MMAATQADVVIEIEERPIVKAEVNNNALIKGGRQYFHIYLLLLMSVFCLLPTLQLQAEKVRFSVFTDRLLITSLKILSFLVIFYCVGGGGCRLVEQVLCLYRSAGKVWALLEKGL